MNLVYFFCLLRRKFKMAVKNGGKTFLRKVASRLCRYTAGQKFCGNRSISLRFWNKRVFTFNAKLQDGRQKWQENNFCKKWPVDSVDTLWVKNFVEIALSCSVSEINPVLFLLHLTQEFKMADKSGSKQFLQKVAKNFVKIALSHSVSKINWLLCLTQKFKMATKMTVKRFFQKVASRLWRYPALQNFRQNCSISLRFQDKCVFAFSALRKLVTFNKSLISRPFCIGSLPKLNDFHMSI